MDAFADFVKRAEIKRCLRDLHKRAVCQTIFIDTGNLIGAHTQLMFFDMFQIAGKIKIHMIGKIGKRVLVANRSVGDGKRIVLELIQNIQLQITRIPFFSVRRQI